jgi:peptidoglycan/LPS O-acetylase OafA/YrhL
MTQSWTSAYSDSGFTWISQAWTLSVELVFYLMFPFVATAARSLSFFLLLGICALNALFLVYGGIAQISPGADADNKIGIPVWLLSVPLPLSRTPEFLLGVILHTLIRKGESRDRLYHPSILIILCCIILMLLSVGNNAHIVSFDTVLVGLFFVVIYRSDNIITRIAGSPFLVVLGSASYALYLLQGPSRKYLGEFLPEPYGRLMALPITILLSVLVCIMFEQPARRAIMRFNGHKQIQREPSSGAAIGTPLPATRPTYPEPD